MSETKVKIRFYTIADFNEEEIWLRKEHQSGWKLVKMVPPCFYHFEKCQPEDVIYRLDFKNNGENADYMQMMKDYNWEYFEHCVGWLYFRKPAAEVHTENDGELFSDNESRAAMIAHVIKVRLRPILAIFLCAVVPNATRISAESVGNIIFSVICSILLVFYVYLIVHCTVKLKKLKDEVTIK